MIKKPCNGIFTVKNFQFVLLKRVLETEFPFNKKEITTFLPFFKKKIFFYFSINTQLRLNNNKKNGATKNNQKTFYCFFFCEREKKLFKIMYFA